MKKHFPKIIALSFLIVLIDQLSKYLVLSYLNTPIPIIDDFFKLAYTENFGIAFSINIPYIFLILATLALIVIIFIFASKELDLNKKISRYSIAFVVGGGISNLIDRIIHGFVVDFISVGPWPVFNIADIFISVGVLLLLAFYGKIKGPLRTQNPEINNKNARRSKISK